MNYDSLIVSTDFSAAYTTKQRKKLISILIIFLNIVIDVG